MCVNYIFRLFPKITYNYYKLNINFLSNNPVIEIISYYDLGGILS